MVASYFLFEVRGVLFAPSLEILEPINGATISTTQMRIAGKTNPSLKVWVGGREFIANEKGNFEGTIPVSPGYNEIGIFVKDRFGNETRKVLKIFVK